MASTQKSPGRRFRDALADAPLMIPGVFNALTARMAERAGFRAVYQSGAALSAGLAGLPDVGLLTQTEFAEQARYLTAAVDVPVVSDADTGFGPPVVVARTVRLFERAGLAGLHLEDQQQPKRCGHLRGKALVPPEEMTAKIRAAVDARDDPDFTIIARTDARAVTGFDDAVERALRYVDAGADVVFPEALESADEFAAFAERMPVPLLANSTEFGKSPLLSAHELAELGVAAVLYPVTLLRVAMKSVEAALGELHASGTQIGILDRMQSRAELYELLDYDDLDERDKAWLRESVSDGDPHV